MSICTLAEGKEFARISHSAEDVTLAIILAAAEDWVTNFCGFAFGSSSSQSEIIDSNGDESLWPSKLPISSVSAVEDAWDNYTEIDADSYTASKGRIEMKNGGRWDYGVGRYRVTYSGGYVAATIPNQIKLAILTLFARWYQNRATQNSASAAGASMSWATLAGSDVQEMLKPYRLGEGGIF